LFKVSDFIVKPVAVSMVYTQLEAFDILGIVATTRRLGPNPKRRLQQDARAAAVNTPGYIVVYGTVLTLGGAWAQDTDGTVTRELKILPDNDGLIARDSCLELSQSSLYISGHVCSEITDCETPDYSTNKGQIYGERTEAGDSSGDIQIRQAGFAAICYCDRICNEIQNWFVAGRILVAGPTGGQTWVFSVGVAFSMDIQGIALEEDNYAIVIDGASECGVADPSFLDGNVFGPQLNPKLIVGGTANKILSMGMDEFGRGVRIDFTTSHGLLDGDMITLKDIESKRPGATEDRIASEDAMINTAHKVVLICDGLVDGVDCFAIAIPIFFTSLQDNDIFLDNALWHRSNIETFNDIRGVVANTYKVCWSQQGPQDDYSTYVGTAGMLVITEPPLLDAGLGMTSIEPNVGAPFIIYFTTGDKGKYSEAEGSMQLKFVFQDRSYLRPLKRDNSEADVCSSASGPCPTVHDRSQVICGTYITEVWSDDPNGFPHPDGCYLSIDETGEADPRRNQGRRRVPRDLRVQDRAAGQPGPHGRRLPRGGAPLRQRRTETLRHLLQRGHVPDRPDLGRGAHLLHRGHRQGVPAGPARRRGYSIRPLGQGREPYHGEDDRARVPHAADAVEHREPLRGAVHRAP
jgi:hypothetical protein